LLVFPENAKIDYGIFFDNNKLKKKAIGLKDMKIATTKEGKKEQLALRGRCVEWFLAEIGFKTVGEEEEDDDMNDLL